MLILKNIAKSFDEKEVLKDVSLSIGKGEVVALVGYNGQGKTTLFEILAGDLEADSGTIQKNVEIGYLPQQFDAGDATVGEFLISRVGAREPHEIRRVFAKLTFSVHLDKKVHDLSGGQKTKLYLAALLLTNPAPGILLLDEPTNNLDLEGIFFLEKFISDFGGSVFITSHDRAFLDETVDRVIELENGKVKNFGGNYTFYKNQKDTQKKIEERDYRRNKAEIKKLEQGIQSRREDAQQSGAVDNTPRDNDKFAAGFFAGKSSKIDQVVQSLETKLARVEELEKPEERLSYAFSFSGQTFETKFMISAEHITHSFEGAPVLKDVNFSLTGNRHVWISGANGSGKTTLITILARKLKPDSGSVTYGSGVSVGYYSQEIIALDDTRTALEILTDEGASETQAFRYVLTLHLTDEDMKKPINTLSRGQVTKIEFVKLLMKKYALLILDEPTNHLETDTREEIEAALKEFNGAIIVASHDRYFLEAIGIDTTYKMVDGTLINE